jgi:hypothetical protein
LAVKIEIMISGAGVSWIVANLPAPSACTRNVAARAGGAVRAVRAVRAASAILAASIAAAGRMAVRAFLNVSAVRALMWIIAVMGPVISLTCNLVATIYSFRGNSTAAPVSSRTR